MHDQGLLNWHKASNLALAEKKKTDWCEIFYSFHSMIKLKESVTWINQIVQLQNMVAYLHGISAFYFKQFIITYERLVSHIFVLWWSLLGFL